MNAIPGNLTILTANLNWVDRVKQFFHNHHDTHNFKYLFATRNKNESIKPFLDGLEAKYLIITPELIVVEINSLMDSKLERLKFEPTVRVCPATSEFKKLLKLTDGLFEERIYQTEYNFELYLVEPCDWDKITLARAIVDDLKTKEEHYFFTFITVYHRLKQNEVN